VSAPDVSAALLAPYLRAYISGDTRTRDERLSLLARRSGLSIRAVKRIIRADADASRREEPSQTETEALATVGYFQADALLVQADAVFAWIEDTALAALRVAGLPDHVMTDDVMAAEVVAA
jgi:hypothetical protein